MELANKYRENNSNPELAAQIYEKYALEGNQEAQRRLAWQFFIGVGVEKDLEKAMYWYSRLAEADNEEGFLWMGVLYAEGVAVEKDIEKAKEYFSKVAYGETYYQATVEGKADAQSEAARLCFERKRLDRNSRLRSEIAEEEIFWYTKAAEQGKVYAMYRLGRWCLRGNDTEVDGAKAFEWFERGYDQEKICEEIADYLYMTGWDKTMQVQSIEECEKLAEKGNLEAQCEAAVRYFWGIGTTENWELAKRWAFLAAEAGEAEAQYYVFVILDYYKSSENKKEAFEWCKKAAEQEYVPAIYHMGKLCAIGKGTGISLEKAILWYDKAAEKGHKYAYNERERLQALKKCAEENVPEALKQEMCLAEGGDPDAQEGLAYRYMKGYDVLPDEEKALYWSEKAANQGNVNAQYRMARFYMAGEVVDRDPNIAAYWYEKAAENGIIEAMYQLGRLYYDGKDIERNPELAAKWMSMAARKDHARAMCVLGHMYCDGFGVEKSAYKAREMYRRAADRGCGSAMTYWELVDDDDDDEA